MFASDPHVVVVVAAQGDAVAGILEQREGGEERKFNPMMENQVGFDPAIRYEQAVGIQLG